MPTNNLYHTHIGIGVRANGQSAAAAVAYISGLKIIDSWLDEPHDYTSRKGVLKSQCVNFEGTPTELAELMDRAENRWDSRVFRSVNFALPCGFSQKQLWNLTEKIAETAALLWDVAVVAALHAPSEDGDPNNHHGHLVFSTRKIENGVLTEKTRELDLLKTGSFEVRLFRWEISDIICKALIEVGRKNEVGQWDHRSFETRGISAVPTKHLGPRRTREKRAKELKERAAIRAEIRAGLQRMDDEELRIGIDRLDSRLVASKNGKNAPADSSPVVDWLVPLTDDLSAKLSQKPSKNLGPPDQPSR